MKLPYDEWNDELAHGPRRRPWWLVPMALGVLGAMLALWGLV